MPQNIRIGSNPGMLPAPFYRPGSLVNVPMTTPGRLGVNLQQQNMLLPMDWAYDAQNAVIDASHRLAGRNGVTSVTTTEITGAYSVKALFEQRRADGSSDLLIAWDQGISNNAQNPSANLITGTAPTGNGRWFLVNFNDKAIGFQSGQTPIVRTTGNFAPITVASGTIPTGGVGGAAFGRVWGVMADGHTIAYSALLDETKWASADGGGQIDMAKVWTQGTDVIKAIVGFNGMLVIFGLRHIVFWGDNGAAGVIGLDPTQISIQDVIEGTGTVSQWTVAAQGEGDLIFLSPTGVQSLARLIIQKSRPVASLSKYVRDTMIGQLANETTDNITGVYSQTYGFYAVSFPVSGVTWVVDLRFKWQDEAGDEVGAVTYWDFAPTSLWETIGRVLYMGKLAGYVGKYDSAGVGDDGTAFNFVYSTPWLDLDASGQYGLNSRVKMLKRLGAILYMRGQNNVTFNWYTDFQYGGGSSTVTTATVATAAEWGTGQWGISEWAGGSSLEILHVNPRATGQYIRFSMTVPVTYQFAVHQTQLFAKLGRMASS